MNSYIDTKGTLQIPHVKRYPAFELVYEDIGNEAIQVEVTGRGLLNYFGELTSELEIEINTGIIQALRKYGDITTHDASEIGYELDLTQTKKLNRTYNLFETTFELYIMFKKPIVGASAYSLRPTIELITATILAEAFIIK